MKRLTYALYLIACLPFTACQPGGADAGAEPEEPLFQALPAERTGLDFTNTVTNDEDFNIFNYRNFYNGGGVGLGDLNNDGLTDIFLTANLGPNKLYLNRGDWRFEDVSAAAGIEDAANWSTGVALIDLDADGWLDIYVANAGFRKGGDQRNRLYLNNQDGTFREAAADYGLDDAGYTTHAAFVDYDLDGDLDVYLLNNSFIPVSSLNYSNQRERYAEDWPVKPFLRGGGDKLLRNDGGRFTDVSRAAGIYGSLIGFGLGVTVGDVNGDHYPDLYVSNDFYERDYLYVNQGDGTFREEVEQYMRHLSLASMGADLADLDQDGRPELFATEMLPETDYRRKTTVQFENLNTYTLKQRRGFYHQFMHNTLQANNGDGTFSEVAHYAGVEATDWSWGALLFDADNDGLRDIYVCNGIYHNLTDQDFIDFFANDVVQRMALTGKKEAVEEVIAKMPSQPLPNKFFRNTGGLRFADATAEWTPATPSFSNGAAYADLDNDGDLDLVVSNVNQPVTLLRNRAERLGHRSLTVRLSGPPANPLAVGATVYAYTGGRTLSQQIMPTRGFQSSVDYPVIFGFGAQGTVDSLRVVWPDRREQRLAGPITDSLLRVAYRPEPPPTSNPAPAAPPPRFAVRELGLLAHAEDDFNDLQSEGLLMRTLTREGPALATADLDGDGLDDLVVGGARDQPTMVYLQRDGRLEASEQAVFQQLAPTETTALALFDADGDGDTDLYLANGGNFAGAGNPFLGDVLLFNDGAGQFSTRPGGLPAVRFNTGAVVPLDYDADGDLDLFVGIRSKPEDYGAPAGSYLWRNDGSGRFSDVTATAAPVLENAGMVTAATLTELGLVVVSEWGAPQIYRVDEGQLTPHATSLDELFGWWYAVAATDLDGDGDTDLVLGNRGENFYFDASDERPVCLYVGDFDGNGASERLLTQRDAAGRDRPLMMKRDVTAVLPGLKKSFLKHGDYARADVSDLMGRPESPKDQVLMATTFASVIARNDGNGQFTTEPLPGPVQFSSVQAALARDFTGDGRPDLLLAGNFSGYLPQFGRQDASYGHLLTNDGAGGLHLVPNRESGLKLLGDVRALVPLTLGGRPVVVAAVNDAEPVVLEVMGQSK